MRMSEHEVSRRVRRVVPVLEIGRLWADGLDGQEDELDDVAKGKLDPPTDDERPGSIDDKNDRGRRRETEDEDNELGEKIEGDKDDLTRREEALGIKLPPRPSIGAAGLNV